MTKRIILPFLLTVILVLFICTGCSKNDPASTEDNTAPSVPLLVTPANGDTAVATYLTLGWNATSGASGYTIQISTDSMFITYICNKNGLRETNNTISTLDPLTSYYWRVKAVNAYGTSEWSDIWEFKTSPVKSVTVEWIVIPAGNFTMGSTEADTVTWPYSSGEYPQHTVYLAAYQISKYEITNAQYKAFMDAGGYTNSAYWTTDGWTWKTTNSINEPAYWTAGTYNSGIAYPNHPVVGVSWYEAYAFCYWAGGHLPTEAQWEKAARYTDARYYPWGSTWDGAKCNSSDNTAPDTFAYSRSPVGFFSAGQSYYGGYDMAGNVWEWCNDWYGSAYYSDPGANTNPTGPTTGSSRVLRGGSFGSNDCNCRVAVRGSYYLDGRLSVVGFRAVQ